MEILIERKSHSSTSTTNVISTSSSSSASSSSSPSLSWWPSSWIQWWSRWSSSKRGLFVTQKARNLFHSIRTNLIEYKRDHLIGVTTLLLTSQAMLLTRATRHHSGSFATPTGGASVLTTFINSASNDDNHAHNNNNIHLPHGASGHNSAESLSTAFLFEVMKLFLCCVLICLTQTDKLTSLIKATYASVASTEARLYGIPALLHIINDNILFGILTMVESTTFEILGNMKIIITSLLHMIIFKRPIHKVQWMALLLLSIGSATTQLVTCGSHTTSAVPIRGFLLIGVYCVLSSFSGVFTEYLMKKKSTNRLFASASSSPSSPSSDSFLLQNFTMCFYGVVLNGLVLTVLHRNELVQNGILELAGRNKEIVLIIVNHALCGFAVSAITKYSNYIAIVYSSSVAMVLTAIVSSIMSHNTPSIQLIFGIAIIVISLYLYYMIEYDEDELFSTGKKMLQSSIQDDDLPLHHSAANSLSLEDKVSSE